MGSIPTFLLKKLYVKGSLKNTTGGFELAIQNTLAPGTIAGLAPLRVDGQDYPLEKITVVLPNGNEISAVGVSGAAPLRFAIGDKVTIQVAGDPLPAGVHNLTISPKTKEAGLLEIAVQDTIG